MTHDEIYKLIAAIMAIVGTPASMLLGRWGLVLLDAKKERAKKEGWHKNGHDRRHDANAHPAEHSKSHPKARQ